MVASKASCDVFTAPSVDVLLFRLAEALHEVSGKFAADRWWQVLPGRISPAKSSLSGSVPLATERAPGLNALLRAVWVSNAQGAEGYLLVNFWQTPVSSKEDWIRAVRAPVPDRFLALSKPIKRVTLWVRVGGLNSENRGTRQRARRLADNWRFNPDRRSPLENRIERLSRRGKDKAADRLRAFVDTLHPEVRARRERRETSGWRTVWLDPHQQAVEDVHFLLVLHLLQEGMIPATADQQTQAVEYLKRFPGVGDDGTAFVVFDALRRDFTEPEDWRALRTYVKRVAHHMNAKERRQPGTVSLNPDNAGIGEVHDEGPEGTTLQDIRAHRGKLRLGHQEASPSYSVRAAAAQLASEGRDISPDTLYDWIRAGKVSAQQERGRWRLTPADLNQVRQRLRERERRAFKEFLVQRGRKPEAAKKWVQRRRGLSLEQLARQVLEHTARATEK